MKADQQSYVYLEFCTFPYTPLPIKGERIKVRGFNERVLSTLTPALSLLKKEGEGRNLHTSSITKCNVYLMMKMNKSNTVIYVGVTSDLERRIYEHEHKFVDGFTKRYNVSKLVYYETFDHIENAILREKQIKGGSRARKLELIKSMNPHFEDLYQKFEVASPLRSSQ